MDFGMMAVVLLAFIGVWTVIGWIAKRVSRRDGG